MARPGPIYQADPAAAPDSEFERGRLAHLVSGNRGRLLDARRTPVTIVALARETGLFEVEIDAFEDAGARWTIPFEEVGRFQFHRGSSLAPAREVTGLERTAARLDRTTTIPVDPDARDRTRARVAAERVAIRDSLERAGLAAPLDPTPYVARREGEPALCAALGRWLAERDLAEMDRVFTTSFVSNPWSGEVVKGHAIVLAELGLCPYDGKIVRDPELFAGARSRDRRAEHLIARLAFAQEVWGAGGHTTVTLFRGAAAEGELAPRPPASLVSATFSRTVAEAHFEGGPSTRVAVLVRQEAPLERLVMSFLETEAMNAPYREAEAVLLGNPHDPTF